MINRLTISHKLIIISLLLLATMIAMTTLTSAHLNNMRNNIHTIESTHLPIRKVITSISNNQLQQAILFEKANTYAFEMEVDPDIQLEFESAVNNINSITETSISQLESLEKLTSIKGSDNGEEKDQGQLTVLNTQVKEVLSQYSIWTSHISDVMDSLKESDYRNATLSSDQVTIEGVSLEERISASLLEVDNFTDTSINNLDKEGSSILQEAVLFIVIASIIAAALVILNVKSISNDIQKVRNAISKMGNGDLNKSLENTSAGKDLEVMLDDLEDLRSQLSTIISTIVRESSSVSDSALQMNNLANNSLDTIEKERTEINVLAVALQQMESSSRDIAHNAVSTQEASKKVIQFSQSSQSDMNNAIDSMENLDQSLTHSAQRITTLEEQGNRIGAVLDVIKSIADQTNLLALNAAIEAARAGEQGRGFAVVADEVRTLAKRTQDSTREIEEMISAFKNETSGAVDAMKESQNYAQIMMSAAQGSKDNLFEIGSSMENVDGITQLTASSAEEQSNVIQEVNRNIQSVNELASDNVNASSKVSNESQNMEDISKRLVASVSFFKTDP